MTLQHLALDQINEMHLARLIEGRASETRDIEYKRGTYGSTDRDCGEYLADISSFANTSGGDIILGIAADAGVPTKFVPIQTDFDAEILRLENIARSGLQPRISGFAIRAVLVADGVVFVIRVPRSYNLPHRIVRQGPGHLRFYARSSAGKYEPNVDELRSLFGQAPQLSDRMRGFRFERVAKIGSNDVPIPLIDARALILHIVPFSAFDSQLRLPLRTRRDWFARFRPPTEDFPDSSRINVDGLITISGGLRDTGKCRAYVQVFHTGIVEAVVSNIVVGNGTAEYPLWVSARVVEASIVGDSHRYFRALAALGYAPPFAFLVSLIGVKGVPYGFRDPFGLLDGALIDRDQIHFAEIIVEGDVNDDPYEYAKMLRPLLNQVANAAGKDSTPSFDETGRLLHKLD